MIPENSCRNTAPLYGQNKPPNPHRTDALGSHSQDAGREGKRTVTQHLGTVTSLANLVWSSVRSN